MIKRNILVFRLILLLVWVVSALYLLLGAIRQNQLPNVDKEAAAIQTYYTELEGDILELISNRKVAEKLLTDAYTFEEFQAFCRLPFGLAIMQGDSAAIWTNNAMMPVQAQMQANDEPLFITEVNGSYILFQHSYNDDVSTLAFLPLRKTYGINNQYLSDIDVEGIQIPKYFELTPSEKKGAYAVVSKKGEDVFYLLPNIGAMSRGEGNSRLAWPSILFYLLTLYGLYQMSVRSAAKWKVAVTWVLLPGSILAYSVFRLVFFSTIDIFGLFDPGIYATAWLAGSLGDLFVRCSLVLLLVHAIYQRQRTEHFSGFEHWIWHSLLVLLIWTTVVVTDSLVIDSSIAFDIREMFSLNIFSLVAFLCIAMLAMCIALLAHQVLPAWIHRPKISVSFIALSGLVVLIDYWVQAEVYLRLAGFATLILCVLLFFSWQKIASVSLVSNLVWLLVFSGLTAWIINDALYVKSEESKRLFAYKKSVEKDPLAEYLFDGQKTEILRLLKVQLSQNSPNPKNIRQGLINQLQQDLQSNYFKKYSSEIYFFKGDSFLIGSGGLEPPNSYGFIDAIENNGAYTTSEDLYFINDYTGNYYYLAELDIPVDSLASITCYIRLLPKRFNSESLYPELLVDDELRLPPGFDRFNFAIYYNNNLIERKGEYSYPVMDVFYVPQGAEVEDRIINGYDHLIYAVNSNKKVVVSEPDQDLITAFSYFSFIFFFFLIFLGVLVAGVWIQHSLDDKIKLRDLLETSLKNKIQLAIVSLVVFTFLSLGIATVVYITGEYNRSNGEKLLQKIEAVQTNIDFLVVDNRRAADTRSMQIALIRRVTNNISELSAIHDMDINIYNRNGMLLVSSQPDIFEKGLISKKMDPLAYFKMTCEKETWFIHSEKIGRLSFLSAYVPILDADGEVNFYLNLPYFATEKNLQAQISSFLVALVNVYVLLLVLAAIISLVVSRNITLPLNVIAGTFRNIQLGKKNEPIEWPHRDEIGLLVKEYNTMLLELDKSARLLATSERESAWRDMAKQVAHEIKNPLTPMRLSIQHLQRALEDKRPDVELLTSKVARTLMEQIDNLSFIASEFSNFAVMPKAVNEQIPLNELVENVAGLFIDTSPVEIKCRVPKEDVLIFADRNQVLRVFNNLIKNAIQSIPEDQEGLVSITLEEQEDRALVQIADNGSGIPEEIRDQVFVPNFTTKNSGMGIGLAISRNIIESAGGYIWFESVLNEGTTFFIEFPLIESLPEMSDSTANV